MAKKEKEMESVKEKGEQEQQEEINDTKERKRRKAAGTRMVQQPVSQRYIGLTLECKRYWVMRDLWDLRDST